LHANFQGNEEECLLKQRSGKNPQEGRPDPSGGLFNSMNEKREGKPGGHMMLGEKSNETPIFRNILFRGRENWERCVGFVPIGDKKGKGVCDRN